MIDAKGGQSRDSAESYTDTLKSRVPEDVSERERARDQEATCHTTYCPLIQLRVSQPKTTLRLELQDTRQTGKTKSRERRGKPKRKEIKRERKRTELRRRRQGMDQRERREKKERGKRDRYVERNDT